MEIWVLQNPPISEIQATSLKDTDPLLILKDRVVTVLVNKANTYAVTEISKVAQKRGWQTKGNTTTHIEYLIPNGTHKAWAVWADTKQLLENL